MTELYYILHSCGHLKGMMSFSPGCFSKLKQHGLQWNDTKTTLSLEGHFVAYNNLCTSRLNWTPQQNDTKKILSPISSYHFLGVASVGRYRGRQRYHPDEPRMARATRPSVDSEFLARAWRAVTSLTERESGGYGDCRDERWSLILHM